MHSLSRGRLYRSILAGLHWCRAYRFWLRPASAPADTVEGDGAWRYQRCCCPDPAAPLRARPSRTLRTPCPEAAVPPATGLAVQIRRGQRIQRWAPRRPFEWCHLPDRLILQRIWRQLRRQAVVRFDPWVGSCGGTPCEQRPATNREPASSRAPASQASESGRVRLVTQAQWSARLCSGLASAAIVTRMRLGGNPPGPPSWPSLHAWALGVCGRSGLQCRMRDMALKPISRPHRNGMSATVTRSGDGRYVATASQNGVVTAGHVKTDIDAFDEARREADKLAHPDCDGACAPWSE